MMITPLSTDNGHPCASVLFAVMVESLFILLLTAFFLKHADPKGDGMERSAAFMVIFLPFSLSAHLLAKKGRLLILAAFLAGLAAVLYFLVWLEILDAFGIQVAPWAG